MILFLVYAGLVAGLLWWSWKRTVAGQASPGSRKQQLREVVDIALIAAQLPALCDTVAHANIVNLTAVTMIFTVLLALKSGTEGNLH